MPPTRDDEPVNIDAGQSQFLRFLVHELRNVASPIRNAVHVLRLAGGTDKRAAPVIDLIERQVVAMEAMLDRISDAVRLSQGTATLELKDLAVVDLVQQAVDQVRPAIDKRKQHLRVNVPNGSLRVRADAARLAGSLAAVLDNASKFSAEDSEIGIEAGAVDGCVELRVRDSGGGITPEVMPTIFDFFPQRAEDAHRKGAGMGLGLAMARLTVEMHKGRIVGSSGGAGKGSEFVVTLPVSSGNEQATAAVARPAKVADTDAPAGTRQRVLIADDSAPVRASLSSLLEELGHEVRCAGDGEEALQVAREWRPGFVLLDMNMPKLNGVEAARRLRAQFTPAAMQLVMMSGIDLDPTLLDSAKRAGFDFVIDKLGDLESLHKILARGPQTAPAQAARS